MSYFVFTSCCHGFIYPDMGLTQIPWCWLATASPGVDLASIPLCSLGNWNMLPFIIKNMLFSIPGQLKITMHLSCQNPKLTFNFHSICSKYLYDHTSTEQPMAYSEHFYKTIRSTLSTTTIFVNVHNLESMCLVDQWWQLDKYIYIYYVNYINY